MRQFYIQKNKFLWFFVCCVSPPPHTLGFLQTTPRWQKKGLKNSWKPLAVLQKEMAALSSIIQRWDRIGAGGTAKRRPRGFIDYIDDKKWKGEKFPRWQGRIGRKVDKIHTCLPKTGKPICPQPVRLSYSMVLDTRMPSGFSTLKKAVEGWSYPLELTKVTLHGKGGFADVIGLRIEMRRLSRTIQVGPKCNPKCLYKRGVEEGLTRERER